MIDFFIDLVFDEWCIYDEFVVGIDIFCLLSMMFVGIDFVLILDDGGMLMFCFDEDVVMWSGLDVLGIDFYDVVCVCDDVVFVNILLVSCECEVFIVVFLIMMNWVMVICFCIVVEVVEGMLQVGQDFWVVMIDQGFVIGEIFGFSCDLIGKCNIYCYSLYYLYEYVYIFSQCYVWQCLEGVQWGYGDMDLLIVWKFVDGLYLFCFCEFCIVVVSVWLYDFGYQFMIMGIFFGFNGDGEFEYFCVGGYIYLLGSVVYFDVQFV